MDVIQNVNGLPLVGTVKYCFRGFPRSITGHLGKAEAPQWTICYSRPWQPLNWHFHMDGFVEVLGCKYLLYTITT